jgi:hypothetical protein
MPVCDVCGCGMNWGQGYGLTTSQVATSEAYWEFVLTHQWSDHHNEDPHGDALSNLAVNQARMDTAWLVCDRCAELFEFDHNIACKFNREGAVPPGNGPTDAWEVGLAAAYVWSKIYHAWPSSIRLRQEPPPASGSVCDFCRRRVYGDEKIGLLKEAAVEVLERVGQLKRRGDPSKLLAGESFWVCCSLCASRANRLDSRARIPARPCLRATPL